MKVRESISSHHRLPMTGRERLARALQRAVSARTEHGLGTSRARAENVHGTTIVSPDFNRKFPTDPLPDNKSEYRTAIRNSCDVPFPFVLMRMTCTRFRDAYSVNPPARAIACNTVANDLSWYFPGLV